MTPSCRTHRTARPEPLTGPEDALAALSIATDGGTAPSAILACLDHERRPLTVFVLDRSPADPSPLLLALEVLLDAIDDHDGRRLLAEVVLASSRPGLTSNPTPEDLDAWDELDELCDRNGIGLVDWFVLADGEAASVPAHLGEPTRW